LAAVTTPAAAVIAPDAESSWTTLASGHPGAGSGVVSSHTDRDDRRGAGLLDGAVTGHLKDATAGDSGGRGRGVRLDAARVDG
jgi:hypothetical protein